MRERKGHRVAMIGLFCMLILAIATGCAPAFRAHPQLQEKVTSIKTVAIMPPSVKVYKLAVGGDRQLMEDATPAATQHVARAIEEKLKGHSGWVFTPFPSPSAILETGGGLTVTGVQAELEDTQALFEAVSASVLLHTYEPKSRGAADQTCPEKVKNFDYSLGPDVERLAMLANADALLFVSGVDHISTGGRKVAMALGVLLSAAASVAAGAVAGSAAGAASPSLAPGALIGPAAANVATSQAIIGLASHGLAPIGTTALSVALVDGGTGAILWYNVVGFRAWSSLTDPRNAADLVEEVFTGFPVTGRPMRKD